MKKKLLASAQKLSQLIRKQNRTSALTLVLGVLVLGQTFQTVYLQKRLDFLNELYQLSQGVESESGGDGNFLVSFAQDLNEIRQFLLLPPKQYDFGNGEEVNLASEEEAEDLNTLMFDLVGNLGTYEKNEALYQANLAAFKAFLLDSLWTDAGLGLENQEGALVETGVDFSIQDSQSGDLPILTIHLGYDGQFSVSTYNDRLSLDPANSVDTLKLAIQDFIAEDLGAVRTTMASVNTAREGLRSLLTDAALTSVLSVKTLSVTQEQESAEAYFYQFKNSSLAALAELTISKKDGLVDFTIYDSKERIQNDGDLSAFLGKMVSALNALDTRTELQKKVEEQKAQFEDILKDPAFQKTLENVALSFGAATEVDGRVEYPLLNAQGETVRVLYIDASTGSVKVRIPETGEVQELSFAVQDVLTSGKKKTWICLSSFLNTRI